MARYEVRLIAAGKARSLVVEAADPDTARALVSGRGRVLAVKRVRALPALRGGIDRNERHILFIRLAAMLDSKVGLAEGLRRIAASFGGRMRRVAERLADAVETGDDLPAAMERLPGDFPATVVALLKAGAAGTGGTAEALRGAARFEEQMLEAQRSFSAGLWAAVMQALLGASIMIVTAHLVSPWLMDTDLFQETRDSVDVGWVSAASTLTTALIALFLAALLALAGLGTLGRRFAPALSDRLALALPMYRHIALGLAQYVTFHKLSLLIGSGVGMDRALTLAAEGAGRGRLSMELRAAAAAVVQGRPWPDSLRSVHVTDRASLAAAENREEVARTLHALAVQHRDLYLHAIGVAQPVLRSLGVLFLAVAGLVLFGLTVLPIMQIADHISRQG